MRIKKAINPNAVMETMKEGDSLNACGIMVSATMDSIPPATSAVMKAIEKPGADPGFS